LALPAEVRGTPGVGNLSHWADALAWSRTASRTAMMMEPLTLPLKQM
jgi:hypothetical protein